MIEEVFNYLIVRSSLTNHTSEELIELVKNKEDYKFFVDNISKIMMEEDFILISDDLIDSVSNLVHHYRFDYNKNKEINDQVNYIIDRLRDYKNMSLKHKIDLSNSWISQERENRGLSAKLATPENLLSMIALDGTYFYSMINIGEEFCIENIMEYLSLLNLLLNRFHAVFEDNLFLEITKQNCKVIQSIPKLPRIYLKMIKKILDRLNKEYSTTSDDNIEVKYYLKKKDN